MEVAAFVPPVATARGVEEGADAAVGFAADVERVLRGDGLAAPRGRVCSVVAGGWTVPGTYGACGASVCCGGGGGGAYAAGGGA